jgi:hypothetical protein
LLAGAVVQKGSDVTIDSQSQGVAAEDEIGYPLEGSRCLRRALL